MNAFESGQRKVIPAVLIYPKYDGKILMLYRNVAGRGDYHEGKWNGLGGKLELDESPLEAACRELREESGLALPVECFRSLGVLQFPNFKPHKSEDWMVFVFTVEIKDSRNLKGLFQRCAEGELHWVVESEVMELNLWAGDRFFIPHVLEGKPFIGTIWYEGQVVVKCSVYKLVYHNVP